MNKNIAFRSYSLLSPKRNKKAYGVCIKFCWNLNTSVELPKCSISRFSFPVAFLFWGYLKLQVRINKMVNWDNVNYHVFPSRLASKIHHFMFLETLRDLSLSSKYLLIFLSKLYILLWLNYYFEVYGAIIPRKCNECSHFTRVPLFSQNWSQVFSITLSRQTLHIPPRQHVFEYLFPTSTERGKGSYYLLYQNLLGKDEDEYGH